LNANYGCDIITKKKNNQLIHKNKVCYTSSIVCKENLRIKLASTVQIKYINKSSKGNLLHTFVIKKDLLNNVDLNSLQLQNHVFQSSTSSEDEYILRLSQANSDISNLKRFQTNTCDLYQEDDILSAKNLELYKPPLKREFIDDELEDLGTPITYTIKQVKSKPLPEYKFNEIQEHDLTTTHNIIPRKVESEQDINNKIHNHIMSFKINKPILIISKRKRTIKKCKMVIYWL